IAATGLGEVYAFDPSNGSVVWQSDAKTSIGHSYWNLTAPTNGLGAAGPLLIVPGEDRLVAYRASGPWTLGPRNVSTPSVSPAALAQAAGRKPLGNPWVWIFLGLYAESILLPLAPWWNRVRVGLLRRNFRRTEDALLGVLRHAE